MNNLLVKHYCILKKMMNCTNEDQYDDLADEAADLWYNMTIDERKMIEELALTFRLIQQSKAHIQDMKLRSRLDQIVPKINRDHIFPFFAKH